MPARDRTEGKHTKREHDEVRQPPGKWSKVGGVVKNSSCAEGGIGRTGGEMLA